MPEKEKPEREPGGLEKLLRETVVNAKEFWVSVLNARLPHLIVLVLILGLVFGAMMGFWLERSSEMFPSDPVKNPVARFIDGFYFAIVTMATIGYGDYSPKTIPGKLADLIVIIIGVICFSMLTATLASIRVAKMIQEGKTLVELSKLTDHIVICGWKKTMEQNLEDMFRLNSGLHASKIVVLANISQDTIELFKNNHPDFRDVNFVRSEDYNENVLTSVNIKGAKKAFILADESTDASMLEVDSKTVMTAMTISNIARNLHITAELLDPKFETYLEKAYVAEIIYPRQYGRLLLAHSTSATGFVQVLNSLLDLNTPARITTDCFPEEYYGKKYSELKTYFLTKSDVVLIGLLENVGSYFDRKQEALREAQKTADISKLVGNLQKVKQMKNNNPNFSPTDDYIIPDHSIAILVEVRREAANG